MAFVSYDHNDLTLFKNRLLTLMEERHIYSADELARQLFDAGLVKVKFKEETLSTTSKQAIRNSGIAATTKKIQRHLNSDGCDHLQGEFAKAYCSFFNCSADYLFGIIEAETHLGLSGQSIEYIKTATEYEYKVLDTLLKKQYFKDICYAIYSYMQTRYKEITESDAATGDVKIEDTEKLELAEYRATKHFSDCLVNKIAKDPDMQKWNHCEHYLEAIRHIILSDDFKKRMEQATDAYKEFHASGKGGFNDFIKYLEDNKTQ